MTKHFMKGCEITKILVYKTLRSYIRNIDVGEVLTLESLVTGQAFCRISSRSIQVPYAFPFETCRYVPLYY